MSIGARKPVLPVIVVCCVLVGWLVWSAVPALAAAPETPEVSVEALVPSTTAVVHGVLNPGVEGAPGTYELGTYEFLYKQGKVGCEGEGKAPASPGISLGGGKESVTETLSGLSPDTEYTVCLLIRNGIKGEQALSTPATFTTSPSLEAPVTKEPASAVTATTATFEGELNPGGATGRLSYQLDYNTNGTCTSGQSTTPVEVAEARQFQVSPVEAAELEPNDSYTFCLVVKNSFGEQAQGNEVSVLTGHEAPTIAGPSVANITSTGATVNAEIYPHGEVTIYRVEYGLSDSYGSSTAEASISAQHGSAGIRAQLTGLVPDSEYHYRIIATNKAGSEQSAGVMVITGETIIAGDQGLPDGRTYEMVTPPNNDDSNVYVPNAAGGSDSEGVYTSRLFQVASDGSAVTYLGDATTGGEGEGGKGLGNQFLARRQAAGGWATASIQPSSLFDTEYQAFSSDLSVGILTSGTPAEPNNPPLSAEALGEGYRDLYARDTEGNAYRSLFTNLVEPNRPAGEVNEEGAFGSNGLVDYNVPFRSAPVFAGGSNDFSDLLFEANDALLGGNGVLETELQNYVKGEIARGENRNYLYDSVDGNLNLIDVSPEGKVVPGASFGAPPIYNPASIEGFDYENPPNFENVISGDGTRVYWSSVSTNGNEESPTGLYLRKNPGQPQSPLVNGQCSVPSGACTIRVAGAGAQYWGSGADGRYAFYTEGGVLYRFDAESEVGSESHEPLTGASAGVVGVLGVSESGQDIYFVASGILSGDSGEGAMPVEGQPNLYVSHDGGTPVFIATLAEQDGDEVGPFSQDRNGEFGDWQAGLGHRTSRVPRNGGSIVFMSSQPLSIIGYPHGYPTAGADEVYVYEVESNSLFCASCGSTKEGASGYLPVSWGDSYFPQWISEDGDRVFFDSGAPLVSQDTNGVQDVYEWEREGTGSCTNGSGVHGGCVFLLSGGTSKASSWLIGAGENGDDVFVATRAQLLPEDQNDAFDLYDVRVDGVKPVSPPECTGTGCQGVPAPPPTFATPPSVTFEGVGNFPVPANVVIKAKGKSLSRSQKLARALRACREVPKRERESCRVRARKRYGFQAKTRKVSRTGVKGRK